MALTITVERDVIPGSQGPIKALGSFAQARPAINISQFIAIDPEGMRAYLPQTRSNASNTALTFDTTVFPVVNVLDLSRLTLLPRERITIDTADQPVNMPSAVALSPDGHRLFVANAGSDDLSVIDLVTGQGVDHIDVGANPRGLGITPDGERLFVNNVLDGTMSVIETETLRVIEVVSLTRIPLSPDVLLRKKIFNSASAPLLTTDNWISCATCHFDAGMDGRTWLGFPDGPRNTPALFGVGQTLPIHWSGDLDELHDVELTIRAIQFGKGLITGAERTIPLALHMRASPGSSMPSPRTWNPWSILCHLTTLNRRRCGAGSLFSAPSVASRVMPHRSILICRYTMLEQEILPARRTPTGGEPTSIPPRYWEYGSQPRTSTTAPQQRLQMYYKPEQRTT